MPFGGYSARPATDYKAAGYALSQEGALAREAKEGAQHFNAWGKQIELVQRNLRGLTADIKIADQIFTQAARRGDQIGLRAITEYTVTHKRLNEVFAKSTQAWNIGFQHVAHHAEGAHAHIATFLSELDVFHKKRRTMEADYTGLLEREEEISDKLQQARAAGQTYYAEFLEKQKTEVEKAKVLLNYERKLADLRAGMAPVAALFATTIGRAAISSFDLQRNFRDISLSFRDSVDSTKMLLDAMAGSRGLVTLKETTAAFGALRGHLLELTQNRAVVQGVAQIGAATGVSADSIAKLTSMLTIMVGEVTPDRMKDLGNSIAYFARKTDLGAAGVAEMIGKMEPLITSYPRDLRDKLVPQILALGAAFKHVGLSVDSTLSIIEQMRDITSMEGRRSAAFISSATGIDPMSMMMGNMDPARIGMAVLQTRRQMMQRMMAGGLNANTAASILARVAPNLGTAEEWRKAAAITPARVAEMEKQMRENEQAAKRVNALQEAINELTQGPLAALAGALTTFNRITIEAGTNVIRQLNAGFQKLGELFPGVSQALEGLANWFTDERGGISWGVSILTRAVKLLVPVMIALAFKHMVAVVRAGWSVVRVFTKLPSVMEAGARAIDRFSASVTKSAAVGTAAQAKVTGQMAVGGLAVGGIGATVAKFAGLGALAKFGGGIGGGISKFFGGAAAKLGGKAIPVLGSLIGLILAAPDVISILMDPKQRSSPEGIIKAILKVAGGLVTGLPWIGLPLSFAIDALADTIGKNTDSLDENTEEHEKRRLKEEREAAEARRQAAGWQYPTPPKETPYASYYGERLNIPERLGGLPTGIPLGGMRTPEGTNMLGAPGGAGTGGVSNLGSLAQQRGRFAKELENPRVRQKLLAAAHAEVGSQGPQAQLAFIESVMNRASARGQSLEYAASDPRYYAKATQAKMGRQIGGTAAEALDQAIGQALGGSNITNFATGNESGNVRSGGAKITFASRGERFVHEKPDLKWINQMLKGVAPATTEGPALVGGGGISAGGGATGQWVPGGTSLVTQSQGRVADVRKGAITSEVQRQLQYAAEQTGVTVDVFSGGQPGYGQPGRRIGGRTGSTRHDIGRAADVELYDQATGRKLNMNNPEDMARMADFVENATAAGATGIGGARRGYMGPTKLHIGGGTPSIWGTGSRAAGAEPVLKAAYERGRKRAQEGGPLAAAAPGAELTAAASAPTPSAFAAAPPSAGPSKEDKVNNDMLGELKLANNMNRQRFEYDKRQDFFSPSLMGSAAAETLA